MKTLRLLTLRHSLFAIRYSPFAIRYSLFALLALNIACAQRLDEPLDPVFPSRFIAAIRHESYIEYRLEFPSAFVSPYPANNRVYARWLVPIAPHPSPLPEGEFAPHPNPLPRGEFAPHPNPLPRGEFAPHPNPLPRGGRGALKPSPPEGGEGTGEGVPRMPVVILLHSLGIRQPELELSLARELLRHQIAVLLLTLPYHMERTPPGYDSGDLILQGDVPLLRNALVQAVWDVRRALDWLARQPEVDSTRVALVGISLGAIMGATALGVEPRLHSAVLILGGVDLAHILWHSILAIRTRLHLRAQGYTLERLREAIADVEPMHRLTPALGEKTFVIGARFDIVVPSEDTEKLIRALGNPHVFWLNTGHFGGALVQRPLFRMVRRYLVARFAGENPPVESSPLVPTVRIGAIYSYERDFRLAVGVDFWRSDKQGTLFVTGMLTPRGSSLFAGVRLRLGFSAGVEITARRTTGAVFWHFVL